MALALCAFVVVGAFQEMRWWEIDLARLLIRLLARLALAWDVRLPPLVAAGRRGRRVVFA